MLLVMAENSYGLTWNLLVCTDLEDVTVMSVTISSQCWSRSFFNAEWECLQDRQIGFSFVSFSLLAVSHVSNQAFCCSVVHRTQKSLFSKMKRKWKENERKWKENEMKMKRKWKENEKKMKRKWKENEKKMKCFCIRANLYFWV